MTINVSNVSVDIYWKTDCVQQATQTVFNTISSQGNALNASKDTILSKTNVNTKMLIVRHLPQKDTVLTVKDFTS